MNLFFIPSCSRLHLTKRTLTSFLSSRISRQKWRVVLMDNGSMDGTRAWAVRMLDEGKLDEALLFERNHGIRPTWNRFLFEAKWRNQWSKVRLPNWCVKCENDVELHPEWFWRMVRAYEDATKAGHKIGIVTGHYAPEHMRKVGKTVDIQGKKYMISPSVRGTIFMLKRGVVEAIGQIPHDQSRGHDWAVLEKMKRHDKQLQCLVVPGMAIHIGAGTGVHAGAHAEKGVKWLREQGFTIP